MPVWLRDTVATFYRWGGHIYNILMWSFSRTLRTESYQIFDWVIHRTYEWFRCFSSKTVYRGDLCSCYALRNFYWTRICGVAELRMQWRSVSSATICQRRTAVCNQAGKISRTVGASHSLIRPDNYTRRPDRQFIFSYRGRNNGRPLLRESGGAFVSQSHLSQPHPNRDVTFCSGRS